MEQITQELQEIEDSLSDLEKEGIDLERRLRSCEEGRAREVVPLTVLIYQMFIVVDPDWIFSFCW